MSEYETQPTIKTLLEEMRQGFAAMAEQFNEVFRRLDLIEAKIDSLNERLLTQEGKLRLHDKRITELENHPV
jgi:tetrahydromethanopterin S-methyltransferase subunit G